MLPSINSELKDSLNNKHSTIRMSNLNKSSNLSNIYLTPNKNTTYFKVPNSQSQAKTKYLNKYIDNNNIPNDYKNISDFQTIVNKDTSEYSSPNKHNSGKSASELVNKSTISSENNSLENNLISKNINKSISKDYKIPTRREYKLPSISITQVDKNNLSVLANNLANIATNKDGEIISRRTNSIENSPLQLINAIYKKQNSNLLDIFSNKLYNNKDKKKPVKTKLIFNKDEDYYSKDPSKKTSSENWNDSNKSINNRNKNDKVNSNSIIEKIDINISNNSPKENDTSTSRNIEEQNSYNSPNIRDFKNLKSSCFKPILKKSPGDNRKIKHSSSTNETINLAINKLSVHHQSQCTSKKVSFNFNNFNLSNNDNNDVKESKETNEKENLSNRISNDDECSHISMKSDKSIISQLDYLIDKTKEIKNENTLIKSNRSSKSKNKLDPITSTNACNYSFVEQLQKVNLKANISTRIKEKKKLFLKEQQTAKEYHYMPSKASVKSYEYISSFGYNTHTGTQRTYNEDRISIHLYIKKPSDFEKGRYWPIVHLFAILDGHGGSKCADFIKSNLFSYIIKEPTFPENVNESIREAIDKLEYEFLNFHATNETKNSILDFSGTCLLCTLIVDEKVYIINIGDSRALLVKNKLKKIVILTVDHKPDNETELKRIRKYGGNIYNKTQHRNSTTIVGPSRINPGNLSVARTIGDIYAKFPCFGGLPYIVSSSPDIFELSNCVYSDENYSNLNYMILASDGVYDCFESNDELANLINSVIKECLYTNLDKHVISSKVVDKILTTCLVRGCTDNISVIIIFFNIDNCTKKFNNSINYNNIKEISKDINENPQLFIESD